MTIRTFLDLNTQHLPEHTVRELDAIDGVVAYDLDGSGWLLWVPDDPDEHAADYQGDCILTAENMATEDDCTTHTHEPGIPAEVLAVQRHARSLGCDFVLLDRDGPHDPDLPTWGVVR